jgi:hypothetical protein
VLWCMVLLLNGGAEVGKEVYSGAVPLRNSRGPYYIQGV